jgi:MoxR-like ATPase
MRATTLKDTLKALFPIQRTVCIEGPPGGGKTTIVHQAAEELGITCIERHMPTMLVEDFGILFPDSSDQLHYKLPDWFPVKGKAPERGILLFDDRNQAGADLQKVLANICQARTLHGAELPDGWQVISTGNRQSDRAGANRVLSHLRNRETVLELETHLDDWTGWALKNGVKPEVVSFIRFRPNLLHDFDAQRDQNATPRSWVEGVSDVLGTVPSEAEFECFKGAVGEGAAAEFVGFVRIFRKLPNPDAILLNPTTSDVPTDPATLYALSGALAQRATEANFERVCQYVERMPAEFSVLTVSYAARRDPDLANTQAFTQWSLKHQDVLF